MIGTLHPHLQRLEMFARQHRAGWEVWGNEARPEAAE
jgi:N6-adenosine-specific RNA methylase IME4